MAETPVLGVLAAGVGENRLLEVGEVPADGFVEETLVEVDIPFGAESEVLGVAAVNIFDKDEGFFGVNALGGNVRAAGTGDAGAGIERGAAFAGEPGTCRLPKGLSRECSSLDSGRGAIFFSGLLLGLFNLEGLSRISLKRFEVFEVVDPAVDPISLGVFICRNGLPSSVESFVSCSSAFLFPFDVDEVAGVSAVDAF